MLRFIPSLRNLLQPVNRLPPEILSLIAQDVVEGYSNCKDASQMVPLTHVCRHWHQLLISIPENWTLISNQSNKDMAAVCLQRAKAAPLEITILVVSPTDPGFLFPHILEPYVQNTRTLSVNSISTIEELKAMFPDFPRSMPRLESLKLESERCQAEHDVDWSIDPFEPFTFTLRSLSLTGVPLYPSLLGIRTLTDLSLTYAASAVPLDALLDFLEGNHSLKSAWLFLTFDDPPPHNPQRRILNKLQYLTIGSMEPMHTRALITGIPLCGGAHLRILIDSDKIVAISDVLPSVSTAYLSNPQSPTFLEFRYQWSSLNILLRGPGGELSLEKIRPWHPEEPGFPDFHHLPLTNVHDLRLVHFDSANNIIPASPAFHPPLFPSLETLTIECNIQCGTDVRRVLSTLLSNPASSPLLKTLAFLNCALSEELMEELTEFASEREKTLTSTCLYRVIIVRQDGKFPSAASISKLKRYMRVVDVWMGNTLPEVLT